MKFDRSYLVCSLSYAVIGMTLGITMAMSKNHGQLVAHAHVLLVGFVASFIYAIIHRLWLEAPPRLVATAQFFLHHAGAVTMFIGLVLLYGGTLPEEKIGPILGMASMGVLLAALMMLYMVFKAEPAKA